MKQILQRLIESQTLQDTAGVARGLYRVADGLLKNHNERRNTDIFIKDPNTLQTEDTQRKPYKEENRNIAIDKNKQEQMIKKVQINHQTKQENVNPIHIEQLVDEVQRYVNKSDDLQDNKIEQNTQVEQIYVYNQKFVVGQEKAIAATSMSRAWGFGALGAQLAYGAAKELIRTSIGGKEKVGGAGIKGLLLSQENAGILSSGLCKMRGAPLKLAQALSIQEDEVIPKHVRDAFEKARQSADIMPKHQLFQMLVQELGANWRDNFESFEESPFAAASIGEVHRGVLKDGMKVAVKVQYPGVKESIDSDLNNLRRLMLYTGVFPKQMFLDRLIDYSREELHEECNYTIESEKQMKMYDFLKDDEDYAVPRVIKHLSTERIMTSELIEGDTIDYISENYPQELRDEIGKRLMKLTLKELFLFQTMQTDPNPSNFYFNRNTNKLNLIDFGGVHSYSLDFMDKYIDVIYSATIQDRQRVLRISEELGYLTGEENQTMKIAHVDSVVTVGEPFATEGNYNFGAQTLTTRAYKLMPQMLKNRLCPPPQETYSIHRKLSGAFLLSMKMQSNYNCRDIFLPLYKQYTKSRQGITRTFI